MKNLIFTISFLLLAETASAAGFCYEFAVQGFSPGMKTVVLRLPGKSVEKIRGITMYGIAKSGKTISAHFRCDSARSCTELNGSGDFEYTFKKTALSLKLTYINLEVAEYKSKGRTDSDIGEEFALFDSESEGDDEFEPFTMVGNPVQCPPK